MLYRLTTASSLCIHGILTIVSCTFNYAMYTVYSCNSVYERLADFTCIPCFSLISKVFVHITVVKSTYM